MQAVSNGGFCHIISSQLLEPFLKLVHQKINFFITIHIIHHWKAENLSFKILVLFLGWKLILKPFEARTSKMTKNQVFNIMTWYILLES